MPWRSGARGRLGARPDLPHAHARPSHHPSAVLPALPQLLEQPPAPVLGPGVAPLPPAGLAGHGSARRAPAGPRARAAAVRRGAAIAGGGASHWLCRRLCWQWVGSMHAALLAGGAAASGATACCRHLHSDDGRPLVTLYPFAATSTSLCAGSRRPASGAPRPEATGAPLPRCHRSACAQLAAGSWNAAAAEADGPRRDQAQSAAVGCSCM